MYLIFNVCIKDQIHQLFNEYFAFVSSWGLNYFPTRTHKEMTINEKKKLIGNFNKLFL
jgi:hypothetical protein